MSRPDPAPEPFHAAPDGDATGRDRLLLLSYHFPPSEAAGALRWRKLSGHAHEHGLGLDVATLDPADLSDPNTAALGELPPGTRCFGVGEPRLASEHLENWVARQLRRLRGGPGADHGGLGPEAVASPEGGSPPNSTSVHREAVSWRPGHPLQAARRSYYARQEHAKDGAWAANAAETLVRVATGDHMAVISCGPPHMCHEGGRQAAARLALPFVMDMRDPWSLQERLAEHVASPLWYTLARRYERRCVEAAALVVCNTDTAADAMRKTYPSHAEKIITVLNGFDEEPLPPTPERSHFLAAYAGSIYLDRDPRPLFRAAARVIGDLDLTPDRFALGFLGNVEDYGGVPLPSMAEEEGIGRFVETGGFRPRREAMEYLAGAALLVSLPQDSDLAIPSKVYEYLRFPAWVLAMAGPGSATELVLRDTGADVVPRYDVEGLARVLRARYEAFAGGERPAPIAEGHPELSRREQAQVLFVALEEVTGARTRSAPAAPARSR